MMIKLRTSLSHICAGLLIAVIFLPFKGIGQDLAQNHLSVAEHYVPLIWFAQDSEESVYSQRIDLSLRKVSFGEALESIASRGNLRLTYDKKQLPDGEVTLMMRKVTFIEAFEELLDGTGMEALASPRGQVVIKRVLKSPKIFPIVETVTGQVTDATTGETLPGVNVVVKGTTTGTATNANGEFQLTVESLQDTLVFSFIGYQTQEVPIAGRTEVNVTLQSEAITGEELVVVGYGTQRKVNLTGSVSMVGGEDLVNRPTTGTIDALQGSIPGAVITRTSGSPGQEGFDIQIRGLTSVNNNPALILVDGVEGSLDDVRPEDVESISVLKDAAAASIYGAKAAGGVVLVTTKRGRAGEIAVEYNSWLSMSRLGRLPERLSSAQWARMRNEAMVNAGNAPVLTEEEIALLEDPNFLYDINPANPNKFRYWGDYDYLELTTKEFTNQQSHNLAVSGGTESTRYRLSGTWFNNDGMLKIGPDRNEKYTGRFSLDSRLSKHVDIAADASYSRNLIEKPAGGGRIEGTYGFLSNIFTYPGVAPLYDPNGNWAYGSRIGGFDGRSKIPDVSHDAGIKTWSQNNLRLNTILKITDLVEGFQIRMVGVIDADFDNTIDHHRPVREYGVDGTPLGRIYSTNRLEKGNSKSTFKEGQVLADYSLDVGDHAFDMLGGYSIQEFRSESFSARTSDLVNPNLLDFNWASNTNISLGDRVASNAFQSLFGRVNYNFREKYLLEANLRYDGSSKLSPQNRYQLFPSASAGWRLSEEPWFDIDIITEFKVRGSWGRLGNAGVLGNYDYIPLLNVNDDLILTSQESRDQYVYQNTLASRNLSWETVESSNIGFDLELLEGQLAFTADYFTKRNKNMLARVAFPSVIGVGVPNQNAGELKTWGWEAEVTWRNHTSGFDYWVRANIGDAQNELVEYLGADVISPGTTRLLNGYPVNTVWGYKSDGFFESQDEVDAHAFQDNRTGPGDVKYLDLNGDGEVNAGSQRLDDPGDLVLLGDTNPRYNFGLQAGFNWKALDFMVFFQGVGKRVFLMDNFSMMPFWRPWLGPQKQHLDYWTPENPDAFWPRLYARGEHNFRSSDKWMQDAAYVRLKDIQIGYTLPERIVSRIGGISRLRVYITGRDLWETTKTFDYIDPETPNGATFQYPFRRSLTFGVNFTL